MTFWMRGIFPFFIEKCFLHKQKKKKKHARTIFKFSPFTNTSTAPRSGAERVSEKLVFVIAIVLHFGVCNFSQTVRRSACSCGKSVLSREKTLHRNARKGNGEVYDAATSSVINKKCLNSYVNHFGWTISVSTFSKGSTDVASLLQFLVDLIFFSVTHQNFFNNSTHVEGKTSTKKKFC